MDNHDVEPDPPLNAEQLALVEKLSDEDVREIDGSLRANANKNWRKVAFIVGITMSELPERIYGIPDVYYAGRIKHLVEKGLLESQGDLSYMRYSEVRIPSEK